MFGVKSMEVKLYVDGKDISLNEFIEKFLSGTLVGAVESLRDIKRDWKKIEIRITK